MEQLFNSLVSSRNFDAFTMGFDEPVETALVPLCPEAEPVVKVPPLAPVMPKPAVRGHSGKPVIVKPAFGPEDLRRIMAAEAKKRSENMAVGDARLAACKFALRIVMFDYRQSANYDQLLLEVQVATLEAFEDAAVEAKVWYRETKRELKKQREATQKAKPAFEPAVLVAPAPVREPLVEPTELEQLLNAASPSTIEQVARRVVGIAKGDTRYELDVSASLKRLARQKFVAALITAHVSPEEALRRGDELVYRAQPIFPKKVASKPVAPVADAKPLSAEELAALFNKGETAAPETETIEPARVSETRLAKPKPAAKVDEVERAARAERQAAKEARARLMATDLKAGAMLPCAPKPP